MADAEEVVNTPTGTDDQSSDGSGEKPELFFGKYKSQQEAEKAFHEQERKMHSLAQELAESRKQSELVEVLKELKNVTTSGRVEKDDSRPRYEDIEAALAEQIREQPDEAIKKTLRMAAAWVSDAEQKAVKHSDARTKELEAKLAQLQVNLEKLDPDYRENREMVEELVRDGMPLSKAKEWAKKMKETSSETRITPSGTLTSSRVAPSKETKKETYLTVEERARYKAEGLSDEALDLMEAEYAKRNGR